MGFGFASLIAGPVIQLLLGRFPLAAVFAILGTAYLLIMTPAALYLAPPPSAPAASPACPITGVRQASAGEAVKTWRFAALWFMLFTNITCGIGLLSVLSPLAQESAKMSPLAAAAMVGVVGLVNGLGRLIWASASDWLGRAATYTAFFLIQIFAFFLLAKTADPVLFQLLVYLIISCYGGGFATIPAFLSDLFGTRDLSAIHGRILTAWAAAGVAGPFIVARLRETTAGYAGTLAAFALFFTLALAVALYLQHKQRPAASAAWRPLREQTKTTG